MHNNLSAFRTMPATHIVSLGVGCMLTYNLRRHFNFMSAFPFDWWYTEPAGLLSFLPVLDVEGLYDPVLLERTSDRHSVTNRKYPVLLHHEFVKHWDQPGQPVVDEWQEGIPRAKERTSALANKFKALNASGNRIAFFREGAVPTGALMDILERLFPHAEWTLVMFDFPPQDAAFDWKGDPEAWDAFLGATGLTLDRTHHSDFIDTPQITER